MLIGCITIAVIYPFAVENALSTNRLADSLCLTDAKRHNRTLYKLVQTAEPDTDIYQPVLGWQELLSVETVKNVKPMKLNKTKPHNPPPISHIFNSQSAGLTELFLTQYFAHLSFPSVCLHFSLSQSLILLHLLFISAWAPPLTQSSHPLPEILIMDSHLHPCSLLFYVVNQQTRLTNIHREQTYAVFSCACVRVRSLQHNRHCNEGMWQSTESRRTLPVGAIVVTWGSSLPAPLLRPRGEHDHVVINISHALVPNRLPTLLLTQL